MALKVMSGYVSTSKKSGPRTWPSRLASPESKLAVLTVACRLASASESRTLASAEASLNRPRTLLMPAWRTLKPISLWDMSSVHTPGVKPSGRVTTVSFERWRACPAGAIGVFPTLHANEEAPPGLGPAGPGAPGRPRWLATTRFPTADSAFRGRRVLWPSLRGRVTLAYKCRAITEFRGTIHTVLINQVM